MRRLLLKLSKFLKGLNVLKVLKVIKSLLWVEVINVLVVPPKMTNGDIGVALLILARALTTHVNRVLSIE